MIAGTGSGCGKTTVTCALLQALTDRGLDVASFKCGPDYIDPMFHTEIIGAQSANIDLYMAGEETARALFAKNAREYNVIEGVMGYYDGIGMDSDRCSSRHTALALDAPAVLVLNARGMALSAAAAALGYLRLRQPSGIRGVIFNNVSPMLYPRLRDVVERECGVPCYGFLPNCPEAALESRHLGLVTAQEVQNLRDKTRRLGELAAKHMDLNGLMDLMRQAPAVEYDPPPRKKLGYARVAVARDKAFCFYYKDNLDLLREMGAEIIEFSPLSDPALPNCDGLILGGGYPELYAQSLSENASMLRSIRDAVTGGLPTIAECGGFMYLTQSIDGHPMAGVLPGGCRNAGKLVRFGYAELTAESDSLLFSRGDAVRAHEFHYWDADDPGGGLTARKESGRTWPCAHVSDTLYAGFPHLYLPGCPGAAKRFLQKCIEGRQRHEAHGDRAQEL